MRKFFLGLLAIAALTTGATFLSSPANAATETTPVITDFSARPATFYPTVRDGYRDGVEFNGMAESVFTDGYVDYVDQDWSIVIRNSRGVKVAEKSGHNPDAGDIFWMWSGKRQSTGVPVPVGTYTAVLTVTNTETGETDTATRTLYARSGVVNKRVTQTRAPRDTTTRSARGCAIHNGSWDSARDLHLDCVGGKYAEATWRFKIPASATKISWSLPWESDGSMPWGKISRSGTRTSPTTFVVKGRVTQYRGQYVHNVVVSYATKVRR